MKKHLLILCTIAALASSALGQASKFVSLGLKDGKVVAEPGTVKLDDPAFGGALPTARLSTAAVRDYSVDQTSWIDGHLAGKTAGAGTYNLFTGLVNETVTPTTSTFTRNPTLWCGELDFSCFSPWNSTQGAYQGGVLIAPRHVWLANHFSGPTATSAPAGSNPMVAGTTQIAFLGLDGVTYKRTITAFTQLAGAGLDHDVLIATLDSDLPAAVRPARFLPAGLSINLVPAGTPVIYCNKNKEAHVATTVGSFVNRTIASASGSYAAWTTNDGSGNPGIVGDSGSPVFLVLDGQPVVWFEFHYPNSGGSPLDHPTELAAVLGSYQIARATLNASGGAAKLDTGVYNGQVPLIGAGNKLPSSILPDNSGALDVAAGFANPATGGGGTGTPGTVSTPAIVVKGGDSGGSAGSGNGGNGGNAVNIAFSAKGGTGGVNFGGSFDGGAGGVNGSVQLNGGGGGSSNGSAGGPGGSAGGFVANGGRGGGGSSTNGGGAPGGTAGYALMNGGNAGVVSNGNKAGGTGGFLDTTGGNGGNGGNGGAGGNIVTHGGNAGSGLAGLPGGSIDTSAGGGHVLTKAIEFSARTIYPVEGTTQPFTDSTTATWGTTITGGGSYHVLGYFDGMNWTVLGK